MPPTMIRSARTVTTRPVTQSGTPKVVLRAPEMEFAWVMFPIPKEAMTPNRANRKPRAAPSFLFLNPFFMVKAGPPTISPWALVSRYLTASMHSENFEVRPKAAQTSIQNRAPGPPANMAVATPTMLPVPIVAASAVHKQANGETSPEPLLVVLASFESTLWSA